MKAEYMLVTDDTLHRFCEKVERAIAAGFVCQGGVWYGPLETRGGRYLQAMIREMEDEGGAA